MYQSRPWISSICDTSLVVSGSLVIAIAEMNDDAGYELQDEGFGDALCDKLAACHLQCLRALIHYLRMLSVGD